MNERRERHRQQMKDFHNEFQSLLQHAFRPEMTKPFCLDCNNSGYLTNVVSTGLNDNHPYLKPHIERCDSCKVFKSDEDAIKYNQQ